MVDYSLTNLNQTLTEYYGERQRMKLGELSKDNCIYCGKGYDFCTCDPTLRLGFEVPNQPSIQEVNEWIIAYQDKQAFDLLYETLQEVRDIIHRGIRDGEKGHKRALLKAQEKLRGIE